MIQLFKPFVHDDAKKAVAAVLDSGWIGQGPETTAFEEEFAKTIGVPYAVALNSATSALHLAMIVSGVGKGDEVITTPMTFVSTNHAILYQDAIPVFCDIEPDTLNIDLKKAEKLITPKTKAIVVVHYGGNPVNMDRLGYMRDKYKIKVIEDAAHAYGAAYNGHLTGSENLTCFSFHAVKNLPTGDGGMITTTEEAIYQSLLRLRWCGINRSTFSRTFGGYKWEYNVSELGYKYHMNDINAAIGRVHLRHVDDWNVRRREIADRYRAGLQGVEFLRDSSGSINAQHLFVIKSNTRSKIIESFIKNDIEYGVHYKPNHLYSVYDRFRRPLPVAEEMYNKILSLPLHLGLTNEDVDRVIEVVNGD